MNLHPKPSLCEKIPIGNSDLLASRIGLGCWPMAGITSTGIDDQQSVDTIRMALELGINFFDTAYSYGYDGRSDRVLSEALEGRRTQAIIAHKVGMHWDASRQRKLDGSRETLLSHARECLLRLKVEYVDIMYLHSPDPEVDIEDSAEAIREICDRGWARYAAVSNVTLEQANRFIQVCPVIAIQPYFNMFQRDAVEPLLPLVKSRSVALVCYWVLMKGLLSGHLKRDHAFEPHDRRLTYPIFQGEAWQRAQDLLDRLRELSSDLGCTTAQLVIAWSLNQPGVSFALLGAKRPDQIRESAKALELHLDDSTLNMISNWIGIAQTEPS